LKLEIESPFTKFSISGNGAGDPGNIVGSCTSGATVLTAGAGFAAGAEGGADCGKAKDDARMNESIIFLLKNLEPRLTRE
jgi:hypothetical protein